VFAAIGGVVVASLLRDGATLNPLILILLVVPLVGVHQGLVRTAQELEVDGSTLRWRGLVGPWRSAPLSALRRVEQSENTYWLDLSNDLGVSVGTSGFPVSLASPRRIRVRAGAGLLPFLVALQERVPGLQLS
jgi:hypothetical protein